MTSMSNQSVLLYHTLLNAERSCSAEPVTRGVFDGGLTAAVAGAAPLQTAYAAHDQWSLHTVPKCAPFLLPGELHLLSFPLQPPEIHYQIQCCFEWQQVVPVMLNLRFHDSEETVSSTLISCLTCRYPASSPTKLLCFTRSSSLIHQLPAQYPSTFIDEQASEVAQKTLRDLVFPNPSGLVMCKLSSLLSQSSLKEILSGFVQSKTAQVSYFLRDYVCGSPG